MLLLFLPDDDRYKWPKHVVEGKLMCSIRGVVFDRIIKTDVN